MNPNAFVPESCKNIRVGDRGQRYEVRYFDRETDKECVMGWTERSDGGALLSSAKLWPSARDPFVLDRQAGDATHQWQAHRNEEQWECCRVCGIIRRGDRQNLPCKGPTKMREMETQL